MVRVYSWEKTVQILRITIYGRRRRKNFLRLSRSQTDSRPGLPEGFIVIPYFTLMSNIFSLIVFYLFFFKSVLYGLKHRIIKIRNQGFIHISLTIKGKHGALYLDYTKLTVLGFYMHLYQ